MSSNNVLTPPPPKGAVAEISGNVGPSSGNIDVDGDVHVAGGVCDLFEIRAGGNASVDGVVGAASIRIGGDLKAGGGVAGKGSAQLLVGGHITARHISNTTAEAYGNISAIAVIWDSKLIVGGDLLLDTGTLAGGRAVVAGNVKCKNLGMESGAATLIEAGVNEFLRRDGERALPGIEKQRKSLTAMRATAEHLLRNAKALTAQEKEQATEALFEADELEEKMKRQIAKLRNTRDSCPASADPRIRVAERLHRGVTVRFPRCEATIQEPMNGPLEIAVQRVGVNTQIVIIDSATGAVLPLQTKPVDDPIMNGLNKLLDEK